MIADKWSTNRTGLSADIHCKWTTGPDYQQDTHCKWTPKPQQGPWLIRAANPGTLLDTQNLGPDSGLLNPSSHPHSETTQWCTVTPFWDAPAQAVAGPHSPVLQVSKRKGLGRHQLLVQAPLLLQLVMCAQLRDASILDHRNLVCSLHVKHMHVTHSWSGHHVTMKQITPQASGITLSTSTQGMQKKKMDTVYIGP
jgi:hypothetical protein